MKKVLLTLGLTASLAAGQETPIKELFGLALLAEASEKNSEIAVKNYHEILKRSDAPERISARALYNLIQIYDKNGNLVAIKKSLEEFQEKYMNVMPEADLLRKQYPFEFKKQAKIELSESEEIARLTAILASNPKNFIASLNIDYYLNKGWEEVLKFAIDQGEASQRAVVIRALHRNQFHGLIGGGTSKVKAIELVGLNEKMKTEFLVAAIKKRRFFSARSLTEAGASLTPESAIQFFLGRKNYDLTTENLKFIIENGGSPNFILRDSVRMAEEFNRSGHYIRAIPILSAVQNKHHGFVRSLLKAGAGVDFCFQESSVRAIHLAASLGDYEMISILIEAGADLDKPTAKIPASLYSNKLRILQGSHAPIEYVDSEPDLISLLLKAGAKVTPKSFKNAVETKNRELIKLMVEKVPDISGFNWSYLTSEYRIKFARESLYPDFIKSGNVTIIFPEIGMVEPTVTSFKPKLGSKNRIVRKIPIPVSIRYKENGEKIIVDRATLSCTLFRNGQRINSKLTSELLSKLEAGDVLEVTGFERLDFHHQVVESPEVRASDSGSRRVSLMRLTHNLSRGGDFTLYDKLVKNVQRSDFPFCYVNQAYLEYQGLE